MPEGTKDLERWGPGAQSPITKPWVNLHRDICLEFRKLAINQLRNYCYFHILYLMLSTPVKQGLLSAALRSLVNKVRCWLTSQAVIKPTATVVKEQCLDARKNFQALAYII